MENGYSVQNNAVYMQRCMQLAQRAKGYTAPNPMVGAVLVHDGLVIGEGWHHYYGSDHAEVNCLVNVAAESKSLIAGSTMYVNLEPCAHYGITPPCALRLVKEKVKKVVIANTDPFEKVSGEGIRILKSAGIAVETGLQEAEGLWVNRRFFCFHTHRRPYIVLKWAQTPEGFMAPADRSRLRITGDAAELLVHRWRTEEAAIMVGTTTARNDNPQLTARAWHGRQPLRIVIDRHLALPQAYHLFDEAAATWVINEHKEALHGNIHYVQLPFNDTLLANLLERMYEAKILSVIIEGGPVLLSSFTSTGLWDEARVLTGAVSIKDGLRGPQLTNGAHAFESAVGEEVLQVFINKGSRFAFVKGMGL
jgi:diaminohydroxyphosphoribosylaminopyrimidine deaminase / 5-amino-6-(5-phosphoribosylamino)uracil reductase